MVEEATYPPCGVCKGKTNGKAIPVQACYRSLGLREVEAPRYSGQSPHEGDKVVSPTHRLLLPTRCSFLLEIDYLAFMTPHQFRLVSMMAYLVHVSCQGIIFFC